MNSLLPWIAAGIGLASLAAVGADAAERAVFGPLTRQQAIASEAAPLPGAAQQQLTLASVAPQILPGASGNPEAATVSMTEGEGFLSRLATKTDLYWTAQLNGPSLGKPASTNYNAFQQNFGPLYVYHSLDAIHHFTPVDGVGFELSAKQDVTGAVPGKDGWMVEPSFTLNDPQLWYRRNQLLDNSLVRVDGALSVFPGLTDYSRNQDQMLFSTALDSTTFLKLPSGDWSAYFTTRVRPTFYKAGGPFDGWKHEQLFLSAGHFLGYRLGKGFELTTSSAFDRNYFKDGIGGSFQRGDAYDDRAQLQLNYYVPTGIARVGAYFQTLVWEPRLETSTVGMDLTIHFLRAR